MLVVGMEQLAGMFGVAPKTVVDWQDQGMPIAKRGSPGIASEYDSCACINWLVDRERAKVRGESSADRLNRVKADSIEMDNAVRRKLLIPADQLEPKLRATMVLARERFLDEPERLGRENAGKSASAIAAAVKEAFERLLHTMAGWRDADAMDEEDDD